MVRQNHGTLGGKNMETLSRITLNPDVMGEQTMYSWNSVDAILNFNPYAEKKDIDEASSFFKQSKGASRKQT